MGKRALRAIVAAAIMIVPAAGELKIRPVAAPDVQGRKAFLADRSGEGLVEQHYLANESNITDVIAEGGRIISRLPEDQYVVVAPAGTPGVAAIDPASKISAGIGENRRYFVVEFFPDIARADAERIVSDVGFVLHYRPDMPEIQLLVEGSRAQLEQLAISDAVAYIFPASRRLVRGEPVFACLNGATGTAGAGQYIGTFGDGWDGPGRGSAALTFSYQRLTDKLSPETAKALIARALDEWSRYASVSFSYTDQIASRKNLNILFATGRHGDDFPFDGPGRVLAHTFFPNPPNPEPIAGDLHLDADESWQSGADIDLFSVVLHELGHALGLGHADTPGAVMYPYYRRVAGLAAPDIAAIQTLYAAGTGSPAPAQPLVLNVPAAFTTAAAAIDLNGTTSGGTGEVRITWSSERGARGEVVGSRTWAARSIPLDYGTNTIRFVASDATRTQVEASVVVTRSRQTRDTVAPAIAITTPSNVSSVTTQSSTRITGSATDNVGVVEVRWSTNTGASGVAAGTTAWTVDAVPLYRGYNTITVRALDAAGNIGWRSIGITRK